MATNSEQKPIKTNVEAIRQLLLEQEKTNAELKAKLETINRLL